MSTTSGGGRGKEASHEVQSENGLINPLTKERCIGGDSLLEGFVVRVPEDSPRHEDEPGLRSIMVSSREP